MTDTDDILEGWDSFVTGGGYNAFLGGLEVASDSDNSSDGDADDSSDGDADDSSDGDADDNLDSNVNDINIHKFDPNDDPDITEELENEEAFDIKSDVVYEASPKHVDNHVDNHVVKHVDKHVVKHVDKHTKHHKKGGDDITDSDEEVMDGAVGGGGDEIDLFTDDIEFNGGNDEIEFNDNDSDSGFTADISGGKPVVDASSEELLGAVDDTGTVNDTFDDTGDAIDFNEDTEDNNYTG